MFFKNQFLSKTQQFLFNNNKFYFSTTKNLFQQEKKKVAIIGSGNWGTVAAKIAAENTAEHDNLFEKEIKMWVHEEELGEPCENEIRTSFDFLNSEENKGLSFEKKFSILEKELKFFDSQDQNNNNNDMIKKSEEDHTIFTNFKNFTNFYEKNFRSENAKNPRKLSEVINKRNENIKYLQGIKIPSNIKACSSLSETIKDSNLLVFVTPHQFIGNVCNEISNVFKQQKNKNNDDIYAISLIKGMEVEITHPYFQMISKYIESNLGINCSVLMGANLAKEIGEKKFSEATLGYSNQNSKKYFEKLFNRDYFHVNSINDIVGTELCGTLKNIVALGAGFVDGLSLGNNAKAAILRIGLGETRKLAHQLFPNQIQDEVFFESAGVADLIATSFGGRNRLCAEAFAQSNGKKDFSQIEKELLNGQKLQGVLTSNEVQQVLNSLNLEKEYPLFTCINQICNGKVPVHRIVEFKQVANELN